MSKLTGITITTGTSATIVPDGNRYLSFPGCVRAANGSIVGAYRSADSHTTGGYLRVIRSLDSGDTWSTPAAPFTLPGYDLGTAALSLLPDGRLALVTWKRSFDTNVLYPNGVLLTFSSDNGVTWTAPQEVVTDTVFPVHSYTESPLIVADDGSWLLGVSSMGTDRLVENWKCGVFRSTNQGATWTLTSLAESPTLGYNENSVANVRGRIVHLIRSKSEAHYSSYSDDNGVTFTAPVKVSDHSGAPRPVVADGLIWYVVRNGGGVGMHRAHLMVSDGTTLIEGPDLNTETGLNNRMLYGQAVKLGRGQFGALWAKENSSARGEIRFTKFSATYATTPRHSKVTWGGTTRAVDLLAAAGPPAPVTLTLVHSESSLDRVTPISVTAPAGTKSLVMAVAWSSTFQRFPTGYTVAGAPMTQDLYSGGDSHGVGIYSIPATPGTVSIAQAWNSASSSVGYGVAVYASPQKVGVNLAAWGGSSAEAVPISLAVGLPAVGAVSGTTTPIPGLAREDMGSATAVHAGLMTAPTVTWNAQSIYGAASYKETP